MASTRRLAAIMFTDMVGFTQGAQQDERATLTRLSEQEDLVRPVVHDHSGRVVKSTGDGLMVEFPSALKATECAVSIQEALHDRNRTASGTPIELRIGIHLGDVEQRGEDLFGDAVNLAARVQPTAEAGGIAISQQVFDQVRNKVPFRFEPLAPQALKGVQIPLTIFRVVLPWQATSGRGGGERTAGGRLAVLPFTNISPDPRDAYFSDGLTEEVISVLSELRELRVIGRTSVDPYKSGGRPLAQVGQELGVEWVLQGSVRKDGSRLRFTAQLIEVRSQETVWNGKFDRELVDLFALQSELARQVADALQLRLLSDESDRLDRRRPPRPESYVEYLQGRTSLRRLSQESLQAAAGHFRTAIELDDRNAPAYAGLAEAESLLGGVYRVKPRAVFRAETRQLVARALALDPDLSEALTMRATDFWDDYNFADALREIRRAVTLNPSYAGAHVYYGSLLADVGRPTEALQEYAIAEQLDPLATLVLGEATALLTFLGRFDEAAPKLARLGQVEQEGILFHDRQGQLALARGDVAGYRGALAWFEERFPTSPELTTAHAIVQIRSGHPEAARELLREAEALPVEQQPTGSISSAYAALGDLDACLLWVERSIATSRFSPRSWLYDRSRAAVRADPRFEAVLRRLGIEYPASGDGVGGSRPN